MSNWPDPAEMTDEELINQYRGFVDSIRRLDESFTIQTENYVKARDEDNSERMRCYMEMVSRGLA